MFKLSKTILYNKYLLYFIFAIAFGNMMQFTMQKDYTSIFLFVLVALLTSFFSKNMVVILLIGVVFTNILKYGTNIRIEGFEDEDEDEKKLDEAFEEDDKEDEDNI